MGYCMLHWQALGSDPGARAWWIPWQTRQQNEKAVPMQTCPTETVQLVVVLQLNIIPTHIQFNSYIYIYVYIYTHMYAHLYLYCVSVHPSIYPSIHQAGRQAGRQAGTRARKHARRSFHKVANSSCLCFMLFNCSCYSSGNFQFQ